MHLLTIILIQLEVLKSVTTMQMVPNSGHDFVVLYWLFWGGVLTFLSRKPQPNPPTAIIRDTPTSLESQLKPRHHPQNPSGNPDIIHETPAETPTSSDWNHSSISFSGNPDIIRESQRRRCANVAIIDEIIALALDLDWRR
ncbi:hypothetical protein Droror1_Dr00023577, partial [Drosera rotundifolia]